MIGRAWRWLMISYHSSRRQALQLSVAQLEGIASQQRRRAQRHQSALDRLALEGGRHG